MAIFILVTRVWTVASTATIFFSQQHSCYYENDEDYTNNDFYHVTWFSIAKIVIFFEWSKDFVGFKTLDA